VGKQKKNLTKERPIQLKFAEKRICDQQHIWC